MVTGRLLIPLPFVKEWGMSNPRLRGFREMDGVAYLPIIDFTPRKGDIPRRIDQYGRVAINPIEIDIEEEET